MIPSKLWKSRNMGYYSKVKVVLCWVFGYIKASIQKLHQLPERKEELKVERSPPYNFIKI